MPTPDPMSTKLNLATGGAESEAEISESPSVSTELLLYVLIAVVASCLLGWLMFGYFLYNLRKKSLDLNEIRVILANHTSPFDNAMQVASQPSSNPTHRTHPMISRRESWTPNLSGDSIRPVADFSTTVEDISPSSSEIRSPFGAYEMMIPCLEATPTENMPPLMLDEAAHQCRDRGSRQSTVDLDRSAASTPVPAYPMLSYNICLMDLELRELGSGACGSVQEAIYVTPDGDVSMVQHVAAKYARDSSVHLSGAFRSELEIISKLPLQQNIVQYFGGNISAMESKECESGDNCFIVMELMFTNLQDIIYKVFPPGEMTYGLMLRISLDVISGLDHLHEHGIIHYDLKPSNVLLDEDFVAKLADFGSSKQKLRLYTMGTFRGTLGYIAPEVLLCQFVQRMKVSDKLDIYSLGVVMWEMVTGENPPNPQSSYSSSFQGSFSRSMEILPRLLCRQSFVHARKDRCPPSFRSLIEDCLHIEPVLRPTTKDVKQRLLELQAMQEERSSE